MPTRLVVDPRADNDIENIRRSYEALTPGLGQRFLDELLAVFVRIADNPRQFPAIQPGVRRAMLPRFTRLVIIIDEQDDLRVIAVVHGRQHARVWQSRL